MNHKTTIKFATTIALAGLLIGLAWILLNETITQAAPPARPLYATCTVTSTADSGPGSLRACLENVGPGDTIVFDTGVFPPGSPVTITLSSALPDIITNNVTTSASLMG